MATELERRGADLNDSLWSAKVLLQAPQHIEEVHLDYFLAGADIAISASYQATLRGLTARGLNKDEARALIASSITLARSARNRFLDSQALEPGRPTPLLAASIGPYGAHLHDGSEYTGAYKISSGNLVEFHREQLEALVQAGPDLLAFETIPGLAEGEAILRLLEEYPEVPAWLSFSCRDETTVSHGERFSDCAALAEEHPGIVAIGMNCTSPQFIEGLLTTAQTVTERPLLAYPNSGEHWRAEDNCWLGDSRVDLASFATRWLDAGARLLGGCCRSTPEDIRGLAQVVRSYNRGSKDGQLR